MDHSLEAEMEQRVDALGFELVEMERAGSARRPILRLRIDRPQDAPVSAVTLDDCTQVSRALEAWLDERPGLAPAYVLEVSSPGVDRPLVRPRDFRRFAGQTVALLGKSALAGRTKRLEGELLGLHGEGEPDEAVRLRLPDGEEVTVPRSEISRAHLVFRWGSEGRRS